MRDEGQFDPPAEAEQDRRSERKLVWQALIALVVIAVVLLPREFWFT